VFTDHFFDTTTRAIAAIDRASVEAAALTLAKVRDRGGRLFILGVGGSAGHASHATNDFRKICGFEAYCPTDNVSELTARMNDEAGKAHFRPGFSPAAFGPTMVCSSSRWAVAASLRRLAPTLSGLSNWPRNGARP